MIDKLRILFLASTALKVTFGINPVLAQEFRPVWTPSKLGSNSYRIKTGVGWRDTLSGGAALAVYGDSQSAVSKIPVALWARLELGSSLPAGIALKHSFSTNMQKYARKEIRQATLEYNCSLSYEMLGGLQIVSSVFVKTHYYQKEKGNTTAGETMALKLPDEGISMALTGTLFQKEYNVSLRMEKKFLPGLHANAAIKELEAKPELSLGIKYRRNW